ncbi:hypothetical protein EK21DRAFT_67058 [Setomelanomma holmii]|uniref:Prion-inhibition and propagation HeLo domain-containing protein n=1 Tax=Setomelanomma holmii TaxID=210430 RepID=A0A9P4LNC9_9PLEO|nr:hypothetical protein EK21DRAFT_67058 [Setomelanomma holmii]
MWSIAASEREVGVAQGQARQEADRRCHGSGQVKWVLYEDKYFKKLTENLIDLVSALPEVFPTVKQEQLKPAKSKFLELAWRAYLP